MCSPIEVRDPKTNTLIGCLVFPNGKVKYKAIHPMVAAAMRAFREAMAIQEPFNAEPEWDEELTAEEDKALMSLIE